MPIYNSSTTATLFTTGTSTNVIWTYWTDCTSTCSTTDAVWMEWTTTTSNGCDVPIRRPLERQTRWPMHRLQYAELTEGELAAAEARRVETLRATQLRCAELEKQAAEAHKRAEQLLLANLSLKQREQYLKHKCFVVHGRNARYRIRTGRMGNVDVVDDTGLMRHRLCIHPQELVPDCDTMLAQKLMIEVDEDSFIRRANVHAGASHQRILEPLH